MEGGREGVEEGRCGREGVEEGRCGREEGREGCVLLVSLTLNSLCVLC